LTKLRREFKGGNFFETQCTFRYQANLDDCWTWRKYALYRGPSRFIIFHVTCVHFITVYV